MKSRPLFLWFVRSWCGVGVGQGRGRSVPDEPDETFCCGVFLSLELVDYEVLEVGGFKWRGELSVSDFLLHVRTNWQYCGVWFVP